MKSAVETLEPTKVKLTVEVTYDELKPSIDHAYEHIAQDVVVPGFRKGKVPPRIIDQRVGRPAVLEHAINEGLSGFYAEAVRENKLRPLGQPEVEVTKVPGLTAAPAGEEGELHFTAEVEVRPEITVPALDGIAVTVDDVEVSDEDVAARLDALRERFGTLVGVDRPAAEGDFVVIDLDRHHRRRAGRQRLRRQLPDRLGQHARGSRRGAHGPVGRRVDHVRDGPRGRRPRRRDRPGERHRDDRQGAPAPRRRRRLRAAGQRVRHARGADGGPARRRRRSIKASNQAVQARDLLLEQLLAGTEIPVPAGVVEAEVHRHLEGEGRLEDDEHRAEVGEQATTALRNQILLDTLAEQLEIKVSQNELLDYLVNASRQYGMDPNTFIQTIDQQGQIPTMVAEVARSKALAVALRRVAVTDGCRPGRRPARSSSAPTPRTPPRSRRGRRCRRGTVRRRDATSPRSTCPTTRSAAEDAKA